MTSLPFSKWDKDYDCAKCLAFFQGLAFDLCERSNGEEVKAKPPAPLAKGSLHLPLAASCAFGAQYSCSVLVVKQNLLCLRQKAPCTCL